MRRHTLHQAASRVDDLTLREFSATEAKCVLAWWPGRIQRLQVVNLFADPVPLSYDNFAIALTGRSDISFLHVHTSAIGGTKWTPAVIDALRTSPPPISVLHFRTRNLHSHDMEVISALSSTLQRLHLAVDTSEIAPELKLPVPLELPKLTTLKLELKHFQASEAATLEHLVAAFSSAPITDLSIAAAWASPKASLAIIGNTFPTLRTISLQPSALTAKDFTLVSAFCARRGLAPLTHTPF